MMDIESVKSAYMQHIRDYQAEIDRLHKVISELHKRNDRLIVKIADLEKPANFYMVLQKAILANATLKAEWENFIMLAKLAVDEPVPGLTYSEGEE